MTVVDFRFSISKTHIDITPYKKEIYNSYRFQKSRTVVDFRHLVQGIEFEPLGLNYENAKVLECLPI